MDLKDGVKGLLNGLIDGTIQDLDGPVRLAAERLSAAAMEQNPLLRAELMDEVRDQLGVLLAQKKHMLKHGASGFLAGALSVGVGALVNGAIAGLAGLKV